jgi:hypothetical protein
MIVVPVLPPAHSEGRAAPGLPTLVAAAVIGLSSEPGMQLAAHTLVGVGDQVRPGACPFIVVQALPACTQR